MNLYFLVLLMKFRCYIFNCSNICRNSRKVHKRCLLALLHVHPLAWSVFLSSVRNAPDVFYPMKCTRTVCGHNRNRVRRAPRFEVVQKEEKWRQLCLCVHLVECVLIKWAYSRLIIAQVNAVYKLFKIKKCYYLIKRHISGLDVRKC